MQAGSFAEQFSGAVRNLLQRKASGNVARREPTPASPEVLLPKRRKRLPPPPSHELSPYTHACALLDYLIKARVSRDLLFDEMLVQYRAMCTCAKIEPRPWNPIGKELRSL